MFTANFSGVHPLSFFAFPSAPVAMGRSSLINKSEITKATLNYYKMKTTNKILANNLLYHFPVNVCEAVITSLVSVGELFMVDA